MAITAAAEKTTAAFFMGFPFTKIVVGNKNQIRWLRPRGPPGTFSLNLMLMNARWFEDCSASAGFIGWDSQVGKYQANNLRTACERNRHSRCEFHPY